MILHISTYEMRDQQNNLYRYMMIYAYIYICIVNIITTIMTYIMWHNGEKSTKLRPRVDRQKVGSLQGYHGKLRPLWPVSPVSRVAATGLFLGFMKSWGKSFFSHPCAGSVDAFSGPSFNCPFVPLSTFSLRNFHIVDGRNPAPP